jgi:5,10-methylenetetrahydrofolate reductase
MTQGVEKLLLADAGAARRPLICIEVNPPRGTDAESVLARYQGIEGIDFVNVTDSALAKMRMSGLAFGALFKSRFGIEPLVNLSCRDRNIIGLQSDLLGAWSLGVRSVVALTGDAVTVGDLPDAKGVFEVNSIGLLNILSTLREGKDLAGVELKGRPDFVSGVVVNPNVRNRDAELRRLARKKEAGAVYALSQPVFDAELAVGFFEAAQSVGIDMFVGLLPFKSAKSFEGISKVPGIKIADGVVERVRSIPESEVGELSIQIAVEIAARVKDCVRGFHVVSGGSPLLALELLQRLVSWSRSQA